MSSTVNYSFDSQIGKEAHQLYVRSISCGNVYSELIKFRIDPSKLYKCEATFDKESGARVWMLSVDNEKTIRVNSRFTIMGTIF